MPTITSLGVGSGIDINSLVSQLVAAERAPRESRLARDDARLTTQFTALATLKGAMSGLQLGVNALRAPASLALSKALVGDEQFFTATTSAQAVAGGYEVQIAQLATAARLGSGAYVSGPDSTVGTGTLSFTVGAESFDVEILPGADTLAQIRDAINVADGNTSLRATLVNDTTGSFLVLTGRATGAAQSITVGTTGADAGLQQLADDLNAFDAGRDVAAQDAIVFVSGYEIHGETNTISGAIDGVTLNLRQATNVGEPVSLVVERDDAAIQKKVESFVSAYNALAQQIGTLGRYDAATRTAGPMLGDALLRGVDAQLWRILAEPVAGATGDYRTLASLGISVSATGTLQLDGTKFKAALAADPEGVKRLFSSESGVAARMGAFLDERLSSTGELAVRDERIGTQRRRVAQDRAALEVRMQVIQERYLRQFTAMDTMLARLQSTSTYLTQQLEGLQKLATGSER